LREFASTSFSLQSSHNATLDSRAMTFISPTIKCCIGGTLKAKAGARKFPQDLCFPIAKEDSTWNNADHTGAIRPASFGQSRAENTRCHKGLDMFTGFPSRPTHGRVLAIDDGVVTNIMPQYTACKGGWNVDLSTKKIVPKPHPGKCYLAMAVTVHHPRLKMDVVYGEATMTFVKKGDQVTKGQLLSLHTICSMLHIEFYQPGKGPRGKHLPWAPENGVCEVPPAPLLNPRRLLSELQGRFCPTPSIPSTAVHPFQHKPVNCETLQPEP